MSQKLLRRLAIAGLAVAMVLGQGTWAPAGTVLQPTDVIDPYQANPFSAYFSLQVKI